jgi:hypothetical protein
LDLRLEDVQRLNRFIIEEWRDWVEAAPAAWKTDGFLVDHVPLAVTSRFGQNRSICIPQRRVPEAETWLKERRYDKIRYVTVALATHGW